MAVDTTAWPVLDARPIRLPAHAAYGGIELTWVDDNMLIRSPT